MHEHTTCSLATGNYYYKAIDYFHVLVVLKSRYFLLLESSLTNQPGRDAFSK